MKRFQEIQSLAAIYKESKRTPDGGFFLEMQSLTNNSFSRETIEVVSNFTGIPESKLYDYITFYSRFSTENRGKPIYTHVQKRPVSYLRRKA